MGLSAASVVALGIGTIIAIFYKALPKFLEPWAMRTGIVVMFLGGSALAVTAFGGWASKQALTVANWAGGTGSGFAIVGALSLLVLAAIGFLKKPKPRIAYLAAVLPLVLGLFSSGFLHDVKTKTVDPSRDKANELQSRIGELKGK